MFAAKAQPNEIAITRLYDAPVQKVWDAWVVPEQVAAWWGPRGFTLTTHKKEVRVGGAWAYTMHGPDGTNYENKTVFLEVETGARLLYDHGGNDDRPPMFRVDVRFSPVGTKTQMDMRMILPTAEAAAEARKYVQQAGGNATWDRLAEYLDAALHHKQRFVINRTFAVPTPRMFAMWADPAHLAEWASPAGFKMHFIRAEVHVGGRSFSRLSGPDGAAMYSSAHYLELAEPTRVVYTQQFRTETEAIARHPMAPTWPESMLTVVEFTPESEGETRVTLTWEPDGSNTPEEIATFCGARTGMTQGWTGSFDKLESYLARTA
jgi:uncharacterized protein YndB with AHSA1/START domain